MKYPRTVVVVLLCAGAALVVRGIAPGTPKPSRLRYPSFRVPADNPMSDEKVRLGRFLFYEPRLSINSAVACADCHRQERAFADARALSVGATGELTARNAMTLANVAYNGRYTWVNGTIKTLEQQALLPLLQPHPLEMGMAGHEEEILDRLRQNVTYQRLFDAAFPGDNDRITLTHVVQAISSFERTLISLNAPYDRFAAGETGALNDDARRGFELFRSDRLKCTRCHGGVTFRQTLDHRKNDAADDSVAYHNTGLYGWSAVPDARPALPLDKDAADPSEAAGRFKAPTLRNVAVTAPYMHDGSVATLSEVIDIYAAGGRVTPSGPHAGDGRTNPYKSRLITGFTITPGEKRDLLAFLDALTDRAFLTNPAFGNPFATH